MIVILEHERCLDIIFQTELFPASIAGLKHIGADPGMLSPSGSHYSLVPLLYHLDKDACLFKVVDSELLFFSVQGHSPAVTSAC